MKGKRLATITALLLIIITTTALYAQKDGPLSNTDKLTPEELAEPLETSQLTVNIQHVTNQTSLAIYITNNLSSNIAFGEPYSFYKLENRTWMPFPSQPIWIMPLYVLRPGGTRKQTADITGFVSGRYRVTKEIEIDGVKQMAGAEFIVERPRADPNEPPKYGYALKMVYISSKGIDSGPTVVLYNQGGLTVTLPSEYHVYQLEDGEWVEIDSDPGGGPDTVVAPGEEYIEYLNLKSIGDSIRYVRYVYVESYNKPVRFVLQFVKLH